jgi:putative transposase
MVWLESHRREIEAGKLVVFLLDECHLLWGDVCGYVWGKTNERIELPIVSDRQRQTYFGALNYCSKQFLVKAYPTANSENTIDFLKYLLAPLFRATHCCVLGRCMYTLDGDNLSFVKSLKP